MSGKTILSVKGLARSFFRHDPGRSIAGPAPISFDTKEGQLTLLSGASGSGKSSILKMIFGTYRASCGAAYINKSDGSSVDLVTATARELLALRRTEIAFVTQFFDCLPRVSALDIVAGPLRAQGMEIADARRSAGEWLEKLSVPRALWDLPPAFFSGGEGQRVNLARGFARKANLLLLDEPTASLDAEAKSAVGALINEFKSNGGAIVAVFHDPEFSGRYTDHQINVHTGLVGKID